MSKAVVPAGATTVTFAIPPRFSAMRVSGPASQRASSVLASGAPCPPAAMSVERRSLTTGTPVASAIHAG